MRSDGNPNATPTAAEKNPESAIATRMLIAGKNSDQLIAGIGANPHERPGAERKLAGISGQDVESERRQRIDQDGNKQRAKHEFVRRQRKDDESNQTG